MKRDAEWTDYPECGEKVEMALEVCGQYEKKMVVAGRDTGVTGEEYTKCLLPWIDNPELKSRWERGIEGASAP